MYVDKIGHSPMCLAAKTQLAINKNSYYWPLLSHLHCLFH